MCCDMRKSDIAIAAVSACLVMALSGCAQGAGTGGSELSDGANAADWSSQEQASEEGIVLDVAGMDLDYSDRDLNAGYDETTAVYVALEGDTASIGTADDGTAAAGAEEGGSGAAGVAGGSAGAKSDDASAETGSAVAAAAVTVEGSAVTITAEGTYVISGSLDNGQLVVDVPDENAKVQLVFDGVAIHNETGPAVYVKQVDKCFISLAAGSDNRLTDGADYVLEEGSDEPYATLFSKDDLTLNGDGRLEVRSSYRHAICSKDDLVIGGGEYAVTSAEDALRGRDCVKIFDGSFVIEAGDAAVKSNNDEDGARGFVVVDGGTFEISAVGDAFHAETLLQVNDGVIDVLSCDEGLEGWQVTVNGGDIRVVSSDDAINAAAPDTAAGTVGANFTPGEAAGVMVPGVAPSGEAPAVPSGEVPAASGGEAAPSGEAPAAPEGAVPGGGRGGMMGGMMGGGNVLMEGANESCLVEINGGYLVLDAGGDGVDSNGYFTMSDGVLLVMGPVNSADGTFDYAYEATVSGGTVLMVGPAGMTQSFTSGDQAFFMAHTSGQAGQTVAVTDEQGNVLASMTATRQFSTVLASAPGMVEGETYTLVVGGIVADANADGFADGGTVEGGTSIEVAASKQGSANPSMGGMGGMGAAPGGMGGDAMPGRWGEGMPEGFDPGKRPEGVEPGMRPETSETQDA
ncbi:MAG: carbohydrate-binding domain-containing protein [Eggerthellaceae bacterium]|nr:carbohydrate-binding domain-containing protein [Eggerthellaceae bacterium]